MPPAFRSLAAAESDGQDTLEILANMSYDDFWWEGNYFEDGCWFYMDNNWKVSIFRGFSDEHASDAGTIEIPSVIHAWNQEYPVWGMEWHEGPELPNATQLILPEGIHYLSHYTFQRVPKVTEVTIPSSVKELRSNVFDGLLAVHMQNPEPVALNDRLCDTSIIVYVPQGSVNAYKAADYWRDQLIVEEGHQFETLTINVTEPGTLGASILQQGLEFADVYKLKVTGPLNADDTRFFCIMDHLMEIDLGETTLDAIPEHAFSFNMFLTKAVLPSSLKRIGYEAFSHCYHLNEISLPEGLQIIEDNAFNWCIALPDLDLPQSLTSISSGAFYHCPLTHVEFGPFLTSIAGSTFGGCKIEKLEIPGNIKVVDGNAFESNPIELLTINEGVEQLGDFAFSNTLLTEVNLPSSLVRFVRPFWDCSELEVMRCFATTPPSTYDNILPNDHCILYVPAESVIDYKLAEGWMNFGERIQALGSDDYLSILNNLRANVSLFIQENRSFTAIISELQNIYNNCVGSNENTAEELSAMNSQLNDAWNVAKEAISLYNALSALVQNVTDDVNNADLHAAYLHAQQILADKAHATAQSITEAYESLNVFNLLQMYAQMTREDFGFEYNGVWSDGICYIRDGYDRTVAEFMGYETDPTDSVLYIPSRYADRLVISCNMDWGNQLTHVTQVILPSTILFLHNNAFDRLFPNVRDLTIPSSVRIIENYGLGNVPFVHMSSAVPPVLYEQDSYENSIIIVPAGAKEAYLAAENWSNYTIMEEGEEIMDNLSVHVSTPGTLSELLLSQVPSLRFISNLKISGNLNRDDADVFYSLTNIEEIDMSEASLDAIPTESFYSRQHLRKVILPEGLVEIGDRAFRYCPQLSEVYLPVSLSTIYSRAFANCPSLTHIDLNYYQYNLGSYVFYDTPISQARCFAAVPPHSNSEYIFEPGTVVRVFPERVEDYRQAYGWNLLTIEPFTQVDFLQILDEAMASATNYLNQISEFTAIKNQLQSVLTACTPDGSSTIDELQAMVHQVNEAVNTARNGVTAYYDLDALVKQIANPEATADLQQAYSQAQEVLADKAHATAAMISEAYSTLRAAYAMIEIAQMDYHNIGFNREVIADSVLYALNDEYLIAEWRGFNQTMNNTDVVVPSTITYNYKVYTVVGTGPGYWYSQPNIRTVELPNTLLWMRDYSLVNFNNLTKLTIPASVKNMDEGALNSTGIDQLIMEGSVPPVLHGSLGISEESFVWVPEGAYNAYRTAEYWSNYCLVEQGNEIALTIHVSTPGTLSNELMKQCATPADINELVITGTLNRDDAYTLRTLTLLRKLDLSGASLNVIPSETFRNKRLLESIQLPLDLTSIESYAFQNCSSLKSIQLPETLTQIPYDCFYNCRSLSSVNIPANVTRIDNYAFYNAALSEVTLNDKLEYIGYESFYRNNLKSLVIPASVKNIESSAFADNQLTDITLQEGLQSLGSYSFGNNQLTEVEIPSTVTTLYYAFQDNNQLKSIKAMPLLPPYTDGQCPVSERYASNVTTYVSPVSLQNYQFSPGWSQMNLVADDSLQPAYLAVNNTAFLNLTGMEGNYNTQLLLGNEGRLELMANGLNFSAMQMEYDITKDRSSNGNYIREEWLNHDWMSSLVTDGTISANEVTINISLPCNRWSFIVLPFDIKVSDIQNLDNTEFVIRRYDSAARAAGRYNETWVNMEADDVLQAGTGYIWNCANKDTKMYCWNWCIYYQDFRVTGVISDWLTDQDVTVQLSDYPVADPDYDMDRGWNLTGNPYPSYYAISGLNYQAPITVWDEMNGMYWAESPLDDDYVLTPGEAFFVQYPEEGQITFRADGRRQIRYSEENNNRAPAIAQKGRQVINLMLKGDSVMDRTRVVVNEAATSGYDRSFDAAKFENTNLEAVQLYTVADQAKYAINERPLADGLVQLGMYFPSEGAYTFSLARDADVTLYLTDLKLGTTINLNDQSYSFYADAGEDISRFVLTMGGNINAIQCISLDDVQEDAIIYTLDGRRVSRARQGEVYLIFQQERVHKLLVK